MATFAQIVIARAGESQGVWALEETFTGGSHPKGEHASLISSVIFTVSDSDVAGGLLAGAKRAVAVEHAFFKQMNVAIAERLDSEVPDTEPMQKRVDEMYIDQNAETIIVLLTELKIVNWKEVNTARAESVPKSMPIRKQPLRFVVMLFNYRRQGRKPKVISRSVISESVGCPPPHRLLIYCLLTHWITISPPLPDSCNQARRRGFPPRRGG